MAELTGHLSREQIVSFLTMHRIVHGLTLRDIAEACSPPIAASTVMRYERGDTTPTLETLAAWAAALGFELRVSLGPLAPPEEEVTG